MNETEKKKARNLSRIEKAILVCMASLKRLEQDGYVVFGHCLPRSRLNNLFRDRYDTIVLDPKGYEVATFLRKLGFKETEEEKKEALRIAAAFLGGILRTEKPLP